MMARTSHPIPQREAPGLLAGWNADLSIVLPLALAAWLYWRGARTIRRQSEGRGLAPWEISAFVIGWLAIRPIDVRRGAAAAPVAIGVASRKVQINKVQINSIQTNRAPNSQMRTLPFGISVFERPVLAGRPLPAGAPPQG